ncbi:MAG: ABC-type heme uptake system substrate-binding component HmuT [Algoriphagus marincola HL-49]|uniref:ABC-type heme uptake system substrate-binding component HmuT n=1 Tax=Algoriphagus marincola HL-49 TaxID=1305737 RepID=A0A0P8CBE5_9BACT|nr:MAG: ABC-type heme uptake system substrate-binding component HmuT [Algoriphagus marincola HL-49]
MRKLFASLIVLLGVISCDSPQNSAETTETTLPKIVTAGGTISEIVVGLGLGDQIIATDRTSTFPASLQSLPSIGYRNQIKAEGILSLGPDMILVEEGYLNEEVISQIQSVSKIKLEVFPKTQSKEQTIALIQQIAAFFEMEEQGQAMIAELEKDLQNLNDFLSNSQPNGKAAFVMARGPESLFIAGDGSFSESIFGIAGVEQVETNFEDFVPLTPEALISLNPDYLVLFESGLESLGGKSGLTKIPGITETTAFQKDQIISMDGLYLSGFGPRMGKAALELAKATRTQE